MLVTSGKLQLTNSVLTRTVPMPPRQDRRNATTPISSNSLPQSTVRCMIRKCGAFLCRDYNTFKAHILSCHFDGFYEPYVHMTCIWDTGFCKKACGARVLLQHYPRHCYTAHAGKGGYKCPGCDEEHKHAEDWLKHRYSCRLCFKCGLYFGDASKQRRHAQRCARPELILPLNWWELKFGVWCTPAAQEILCAELASE